jgi:aminoglycoside phosphotransferase (APT) family kinase protein
MPRNPPEPNGNRRALAWAAAAVGPGTEVVAAARLPGGGWHSNDAIDVRDARGRVHQLVLRLWSRPEWADEDPHLTPEREAAVLALLERERFGLEFPRVVAADPDGDRCGVPALLLTRLAGSTGGVAPGEYAAALRAVHALPPAFERWTAYYDPAALEPPGPLWERALAAAAGPAPDLPETFIHRDFNPGNTLWRDGRLTGVIDWTQACTGPAAADAGHLRWNLALLHGVDAARAVVDEAHPWWDVRTLIDVVPELDGAALARVEPYLATALAELGL